VRAAGFLSCGQDNWVPVEAARHLGDPRFLPALKQLAQRLTGKDVVYFRGTVEDAIAACEGRRAEESRTVQ
jgi:hypothetical protein